MKDPIMDLCDVVRETSYSIDRYLRNGHFEKVYENCLVHRLAKKSIALKQQCPIDVYDEDGTAIGHFVVDLLPEHTAQILGYLRACRLRLAMLINFGAPTLQIKKLIL